MSPDRSDSNSNSNSKPDPDASRVQDRAVDRQHERAEIAEDIYERVAGFLEGQKYPTTSEELAVAYGDASVDLPNETESLGDVFDRLVDERYESAGEAREAVMSELTGETGGPAEYDEERALSGLGSGDRDADDVDVDPPEEPTSPADRERDRR